VGTVSKPVLDLGSKPLLNLMSNSPDILDTKIGRLYYNEGVYVPSVTTILEYSKPGEQRAFLYNFKKNNKDYVNQAAEGGTTLHKFIENYFKTGETPTEYQLENNCGIAHNLIDAFEIAKPYLDCFEPLYMEQRVVHLDQGYGGTIDFIGVGKETQEIYLIDWKTAIKYKEKVTWGTYPLQLAAYIDAANATLELPQTISRGKVIKFYQDGENLPHIYDLTEKKFHKSLVKFNQQKAKYYSLLKYLLKNDALI
jgi:hypothetical protein